MNPSAKTADCREKLWLVIPCYNDATRLARFLPSLCSALEQSPFELAVQVVDDGSRAEDRVALAELIEGVRTRFPFVRPALCLERNQGKGGAILKGWESAGDADWLGFLDADGAVPADEVRRVAEMLTRSGKASALFASRVRMRGRTVERTFKRHFTGRIFASIIGGWIDPRVYDSQCGLKLIPGAAYREIKPYLREKGFAFDVELLALLNHVKTPVVEVPVDWFDIPGSKVSVLRDSLRMLRAVRAIRSRMRAGFRAEP